MTGRSRRPNGLTERLTLRAMKTQACRPRREGVRRTTPMPRQSQIWHNSQMDATVVLGGQGRIVIPAEVRSALGLIAGDQLHLHVAGDRLVLERPQDAVAALRGLAAGVPSNRSLVDELLAERRREAER